MLSPLRINIVWFTETITNSFLSSVREKNYEVAYGIVYHRCCRKGKRMVAFGV